MSDDHKQKIREALRRYNQNGGHLVEYRKPGAEHPNWRGGRDPKTYRKLGFTAHGTRCQRCEQTSGLLVHHKDQNRGNNDPSNLEVLCKRCHMQEHHGRRVDWTCPKCGVVVSLRPFEARRRAFCSVSCRWGMAA